MPENDYDFENVEYFPSTFSGTLGWITKKLLNKNKKKSKDKNS